MIGYAVARKWLIIHYDGIIEWVAKQASRCQVPTVVWMVMELYTIFTATKR